MSREKIIKTILYECIHARVQTISANINVFDMVNAAWILRQTSYGYPKGTIFVCVTNPGGMTCAPSVIETSNGHIYIGHDNGLFDLVVKDYGFQQAFKIASPILSPPKYETLFGISLFAPTAAHISKGLKLNKVGSRIEEYQFKLPNIPHSVSTNCIEATVMDIDRFGNATLNVTESEIDVLGVKIGQEIAVEFNDEIVLFEFRETYGYVSKGTPVAILFMRCLQLTVCEDSLAKKFSISFGDRVVLKGSSS